MRISIHRRRQIRRACLLAWVCLAATACTPPEASAPPQSISPDAFTLRAAGNETAAQTLERLRELHGETALRKSGSGALALEIDLSLVPAEDFSAALRLTALLPSVVRLNVHGAELSADDWDLLRSLSGLRNLDLSCTNVRDADLRFLAELPALEFLNLWGTRIGDGGLEHLSGLRTLLKLDLADTQITPAGIGRLSDLTRLQELSLEVPGIGEPQIAPLKQQLPGAGIQF